MLQICDPAELADDFIERYGIVYADFDDNKADQHNSDLIKRELQELAPEELGRLICLLEGKVDVVECTREVMTCDPQSYRDFLVDLVAFGIHMIIYTRLRSTED